MPSLLHHFRVNASGETENKSPAIGLSWLEFLLLFVFYGTSALVFNAANSDLLLNSPDGFAYLRLAGYVASGELWNSVTAYWGPLFTWCMAPFLAFKIDGLTAVTAVKIFFGSGFVVGITRLSLRFKLEKISRCLAILILTLSAAQWTSLTATPDILLAALLAFYFDAVLDEKILAGAKVAWICGLFGGAAYLSKHYTLPFFLVHFPLTLALRRHEALARGKGDNLKKAFFRSLTAGLAGFFTVASIWIILISVKHHRPTIGTAGMATHAIAGPRDMNRAHPSFVGLHRPPEYAVHTWEDPSEMPYKTWSPFANKRYFFHQVTLCTGNMGRILKILHRRGLSFSLAWIVLCSGFFLWKRKPFEYLFLPLWGLMTLGVFFGGYLFCYADQERYYWPVIPLIPLLAFYFLPSGKRAGMNVRVAGDLILIVLTVLTLWPPAQTFRSAASLCVRQKQINICQNVADRLRGCLDGSFAVIGEKTKAFYVAYYLDRQFFGVPLARDIEALTQELQQAGVRNLIIFDNPEQHWKFFVEKIKADTRYQWKGAFPNGSISGWKGFIDVFALREK